PAAWRARYGEEFAALLEDRPLGPFDVIDVVSGAVDARLHPLRRNPGLTGGGGGPMSMRVGAIAAIVSGLCFLVFVASELIEALHPVGGIAVLLGALALLIALSGLSAFQARRHPILVWAAFAVPAVGVATMVGGFFAAIVLPDEPVIGGLTPWHIGTIGAATMIAGSALFAVASLLIRVLPAAGTLAVVSGCALGVTALLAAMGAIQLPEAMFAAGFSAFALGWIGLGADVLRTGGRRPEPTTRVAAAPAAIEVLAERP
ncbi:MAG: hypothetical protein ABIV26_04570, partial [Candidatus Limnocylindrales bacterium]